MKIGGAKVNGELSHRGDVILHLEDKDVVIRIPCGSEYEAAVLHQSLAEQWLSGGYVLLGKLTEQ
jgi:hypothetical protein